MMIRRIASSHAERRIADEPQQLEPWLQRMVDFVLAETTPIILPYVPEITLRLAPESVPLWTRIEDDAGLPQGAPYWGFAWAGGLALARYLIDHPALVAGQRVLDFASGSGLAGIAAAKCGAAHVLAADIDPLAVVALTLNADANAVTVAATASDLTADGGFDPATVDVVLAADAFYDPTRAADVTAFLARCHAAGCEVLIGDPGRANMPVDRLKRISVQAVPVTHGLQYVASVDHDELHAATVWRWVK